MRRVLFAVLVAGVCAVLVWQLIDNSHGRMLFGDFRAFYCGGATLLHGDNPYTAGPLLRCEQIPQPFGLHTARDQVDLPAPFPGYALAVFAMLSLLPYPLAAAVWFVVMLACAALAAVFIGRLCGREPIVVLLLLGVAFSVAVIPYGELAPVILAALTGGALALRDGNLRAAAIALAVVALLPHVALPVFLALFVWNRRLRIPILALGAVLLLVDVLAGGPNLALSYITRVLPSHAASEIGFVTQYSMTWLAQGLGASDRLALIAGNLSYAVMVIAGIWLSGILARRLNDRAFLMLVPAAFAVTFGSFIHFSEITLALPAALLLYSRTTGVTRTLAAAATVLVALPWQSIVTRPGLIFPIVAGAIVIVSIVLELPLRAALRAGFAAAVFSATCLLLAWHYGPQTSPHQATTSFDPLLAEASWAQHISDQTSSSGIVWWIPKLPTWTGLTLLAVAGAFGARLRKGTIVASEGTLIET